MCSVTDCDSSAITRGWCNKHYKRWVKFGDPEYPVATYYGPAKKPAISIALTGRKRPGLGKKVGDAQRGVPKIKCPQGCTCGKHKPGSEQKGYILLKGQWDHPLHTAGLLYEHRKVLYDKIGPGPHACHWDCGKTALEWGGVDGIHVDHLNCDKVDNRPENLVPSCIQCNTRRASLKRWKRVTVDA